MDLAIVQFMLDKIDTGSCDILSKLLFLSATDLTIEEAEAELISSTNTTGVVVTGNNLFIDDDSSDEINYLCTISILQDIVEEIAVDNPQILHLNIYSDKTYLYISDGIKLIGKYTLETLYIYLCSISCKFRKSSIGVIEESETDMEELYINKLREKIEKEPESDFANLLGEKIASLYLNDLYSDAVLVLSDKEINVHKLVLISSSEFFTTLFSTKWDRTNGSNRYKIDAEEKPFLEILRYLYTGKINLDNIKYNQLHHYAEYFDIASLKKHISIE